MSQVKYQVTLSADGKHSVSILSDDPASLSEALPFARKIQRRLSAIEDSEETKPNIS